MSERAVDRRRRRMVDRQLVPRGISDPRVLEAMADVRRELFVPSHLRFQAYDDTPLPIGEGQTISQPFVVALMAQGVQPRPEDRALEIGTGSGYGAAVLGRLVAEVVTIERIPELAEAAATALAEAGATNVEVVVGDGSIGCPDRAPFDLIVVTAGSPRAPDRLLAQLADGGRLVVPVGPLDQQELVLFRRSGDQVSRVSLGDVRFVPLVGERGYPESP